MCDSPAKPQYLLPPSGANVAFLKAGRRIMLAVALSLLSCRHIKTALNIDPRQALMGEAGYRMQARLRVLKRLVRAWLWLHIDEDGSGDLSGCGSNSMSKSRSGDTAKTRPNRNDASPANRVQRPLVLTSVSVTGKGHAQEGACANTKPDDARLKALTELGFRPNMSLSRPISRKLKPESPEPAELAKTIQINMLPEAQVWLFGRCVPTRVEPTGTIAPTPRVRPSLKGGMRAGQAYVDLKYIERILRDPAKVIKRLNARRGKISPGDACADMGAPTGAGHYCTSGAMKRPRMPTIKHLEKLSLSGDLAQWVEQYRQQYPPTFRAARE